MKSYITFLFNNSKLLLLGLLLTCFSGFGQTYFIGSFNSVIRESMGLSHQTLGLVYSLATLGSALSINYIGKLIDSVPLRIYIICICLVLSLACFGFKFATGAVFLFFIFYLIRLTGQGLLSHTAVTTLSKAFDETRGRAIGFATLGYPISEALFPYLAVLLISHNIIWQDVWFIAGLAVILILLPISILLLLNYHSKYPQLLTQVSSLKNTNTEEYKIKQWTLSEVKKDWRLYYLLPVVLSPALINTAIFFQQNHITSIKNWEPTVFSLGFSMYAVITVFSSLWGGFLVDRIGAKSLPAFFALPMACGLLCLAFIPDNYALFLYMAGAGFSAGIATLMSGAMWAEFYGTQHLGSIRSFILSFMIFSTSLSPFISGYLIDLGVNFLYVIIGLAVYVFVSSLLASRVR